MLRIQEPESLSDIDLELLVDALVYYEDKIQQRIWIIEGWQKEGKSSLDLDMMLARLRIQQPRHKELLDPLMAEAVRRKLRKPVV